MKNSSIVAYALIGMAAGTVAYLLFGTKEGRKQLDRAGDSIRDLTKSIRNSTQDGIHKAQQLADRAVKEVDELRAEAKQKGRSVLRKADRLAKEGLEKASAAVQTAGRKANEEI